MHRVDNNNEPVIYMLMRLNDGHYNVSERDCCLVCCFQAQARQNKKIFGSLLRRPWKFRREKMHSIVLLLAPFPSERFLFTNSDQSLKHTAAPSLGKKHTHGRVLKINVCICIKSSQRLELVNCLLISFNWQRCATFESNHCYFGNS